MRYKGRRRGFEVGWCGGVARVGCGVNKGRRAELLEITDGKVTQSLH